MAERVLVTGASGFIATHCILALLNAGYGVRGTVRDLNRAAALKAMLAKHNPAATDMEFVAAELTADAGWAQAAQGCSYVLHVASPVAINSPRDPDAFVAAARDGTLRVLRAAKAAGVKRVVVTSSIAAVGSGKLQPRDRPLTEDDWTNPDGAGVEAYARSKTLAERAVWEFAKSPEGQGLEIAAVNPGLVLGPALEADYGSSNELVYQIMKNKIPGYPRTGFSLVDVRDVAGLQLLAMTKPAAAGERFICVSEFLWMNEVGAALLAAYPKRKLPKAVLPNWVVYIVAIFNPAARSILDSLGQRRDLSNAKAVSKLGWQPRGARESAVDAAKSLVDLGIV